MGCLATCRSTPYDDRRGCPIPEGAPWQVVHGRRFSVVLHKYVVTLPCLLSEPRLTNIQDCRSGKRTGSPRARSSGMTGGCTCSSFGRNLSRSSRVSASSRSISHTSWLTGRRAHPQGTTTVNLAISTTPSVRGKLSLVPSTMSTTCAHIPHSGPFFPIS